MFLLYLAVCSTVSSGGQSNEPAAAHVQALQGAWVVKSGVTDGQPLPPDEAARTVFIFRQDRVAITGNREGRYALHPQSPVKGIDITISGRTHKGIVELEGDRLRLCLADTGRPRPERFESSPGSKQILLDLVRDNEAMRRAEDRRPQEPSRPYPYVEHEVQYQRSNAGIQFAGTLTLPSSGAPFPAVLLITGSGQQDRDETHKGHRPFLVLADYLTRRGIAVLRVDDRETGGTTGSAAHATSADFADDVLAGVEFLKRRDDIRQRQIGLIGHSEGGLIAPIAATRSSDVAFIVLMAGPGLPGEKILYQQDALLSRANGASEDAISSYRRFQERMFAVLKSDADSRSAEAKIREIVEQEMGGVPSEEKRQLATKSIVVDGKYQTTHCGELSPWFRFFLSHDPALTLQRVRCPVLAIIGENDRFVTSKDNLAAIERALRDGGNSSFLVKELPGLNHMFQTATSEAAEKYRETIAPVALETMADWIRQQTVAAGWCAEQAQQLDAYVSTAMSDWHVPGLSVGVVKGEFTFVQGYGVKEAGLPSAVDADTLFQIGSTTKAMTAATVGMLVDDGKLGWDDRVVQHLPEFVLKDPYVTRELTIRDLLTHRSGLPGTDSFWQPVAHSRPEIFRLLREVEPASPFRGEFIYQNVMYMTPHSEPHRIHRPLLCCWCASGALRSTDLTNSDLSLSSKIARLSDANTRAA